MNTAVPSIFDLPDYLQPKENKKERRVLVESTLTIAPNTMEVSMSAIDDVQIEKIPKYKDVAVQTTLTGVELVETLAELRRETKNLKERLRRKINSEKKARCQNCSPREHS